MMNNQQAFDTVVAHLQEQGCRAYVGDEVPGYCVYLDKETGHRCAVGALLSPRTLDMVGDFEGGVSRLLRHFKSAASDLNGVDPSLLADLQSVHDDAYNWRSDESMKDALHIVGKRYHLDLSSLIGFSIT